MNDEQYQHLMETAQEDELYLELVALTQRFEPEYQRIAHTLSSNDRKLLHLYISCRVGEEERLVRNAYFLTPRI